MEPGRDSTFAGSPDTTDARPTEPLPGAGGVPTVTGREPAALLDPAPLAGEPEVEDAVGADEVRTVGSGAGRRVVGDDSAVPVLGDVEAGLGADELLVDVPGIGGGGNDNGGREPAPLPAPSEDELALDVPEALRRMVLVEESAMDLSPSAAAVGVPDASGVPVEAPVAPDFACVSVIDQTCSVGVGCVGPREGVCPAVILATQFRRRPVRPHSERSRPRSHPPADP